MGKPEKGYAVGRLYPGAGARTQISPGVVVRAGAVIYAGVQAGAGTVIGHHILLRSFVTVGEDTQLGHTLTGERAARIGDGAVLTRLPHHQFVRAGRPGVPRRRSPDDQ